ncbi:hypothetical protein [Paenibacillus durus]|uniref:Uncharacterized protein n=1 Tax=Paenibacillus durus ATCC 35681 TaxID=1333534 RepID=A0A0F7FB60_PAEDU|nr:hypothetical protein [Paenibacillus durus]AKG35987.1 hypothetical protein VK70_16630 [Paenibacillus durus ATCC 35681]
MDNKPKWYEQAGRGPFEQNGFTAEHAENVIRTIREGQPRAARERTRHRYVTVAAVACITLTIAGLGWTAMDGPLSGYRGTGNTFSAAPGTAVEAAMKKTADQAIHSMLENPFPLESTDYLPDKKQMRYSYRSGYNTAYIWISTETGAMVRAKVNSTLKPGEVWEKLRRRAETELASLGYKGSFVYRASRYVNYDAARDKSVVIQTILNAKDARVEFINENIVMMSCETDIGTVDPATVEAGIKALKIMNKNRGNLSLTGAYRVIRGTSDLLTVRFAGEASVTMDSATRIVYGVSDRTLFDGKSDSLSAKAKRDGQLLTVSEQKLRSAAEAVTSAYSIHLLLTDYQLKKSLETPGTAIFTKPGGSDMFISYSTSGAIWGFLFYPTV